MTLGELLGVAVSPLVECGKWAFKKFRMPDPVGVLKRREELRKQFELHLPGPDKFGVRGEAIIRDLKRMDSYPNPDTRAKGISPWFKVEVKGLYHRGVEVFTGMPRSIKKNMYGEWRFADYKEDDTVLVYTVGRIPFDLIQHIDWGGDGHYDSPHIYCRFKSGQPYEEIVYFRKHEGTEYLFEVKDFRPWDKKKGFWFFSRP